MKTPNSDPSTAESGFGHAPEILAGWRKRAAEALSAGATTPFYLFAAEPFAARVRQIESLDFGVPIRCWLSFKTQPLAPLVRWWAAQGRPVEVVSEFELVAALREGVPAERLLVNGPAKHHWLPRHPVPGLHVHLDSVAELPALVPLASRHGWRLGLRIRSPVETDPENPTFPTQFGLEPEEVPGVVQALRKAGMEPVSVHSHLRTNVQQPALWGQAFAPIARACADAGWAPRILDVGGGLPAAQVLSRAGKPYDLSYRDGLEGYRREIVAMRKRFPAVEELWLEHGRHVSAGAGLLAVRILDLKEKAGQRLAICDGGRTLHALVSVWEKHALIPLRALRSVRVPTAVHGPTCMAFDQLGRPELPVSLREGDVLLWLEAGAYHLPWETRFSHGLAEVWWSEGGSLRCVRSRETADEYWSRWKR